MIIRYQSKAQAFSNGNANPICHRQRVTVARTQAVGYQLPRAEGIANAKVLKLHAGSAQLLRDVVVVSVSRFVNGFGKARNGDYCVWEQLLNGVVLWFV
jgi:hypothetical protein